MRSRRLGKILAHFMWIDPATTLPKMQAGETGFSDDFVENLQSAHSPLKRIDGGFCRSIANYLQPLGFEVVAAGLSRAQSEVFAATLFDLMLLGLNGFEVLNEFRRESQVPELMRHSAANDAAG